MLEKNIFQPELFPQRNTLFSNPKKNPKNPKSPLGIIRDLLNHPNLS